MGDPPTVEPGVDLLDPYRDWLQVLQGMAAHDIEHRLQVDPTARVFEDRARRLATRLLDKCDDNLLVAWYCCLLVQERLLVVAQQEDLTLTIPEDLYDEVIDDDQP